MTVILADIAMSYVKQAAPNFENEPILESLHQAFATFISENKNQDAKTQVTELLESHIGSTEPLDKIETILSVPEQPPPIVRADYFQDSLHSIRKKTRPWSSMEDARLLAGINKYGLDNWVAVAKFVGNGRSRAQCAQRWVRGLDPRISKDQWSPEDEAKMLELMKTSSNKGWTTIAAGMGNRSDVQCRYHFLQMQRDGKLSPEFASMFMPQDKPQNGQIPLPMKHPGRPRMQYPNYGAYGYQPFGPIPGMQQATAKIQRQRAYSMQATLPMAPLMPAMPPAMPAYQPPPFQPAPFQSPYAPMMPPMYQPTASPMQPFPNYGVNQQRQSQQHPLRSLYTAPIPPQSPQQLEQLKVQRRSSLSIPKTSSGMSSLSGFEMPSFENGINPNLGLDDPSSEKVDAFGESDQIFMFNSPNVSQQSSQNLFNMGQQAAPSEFSQGDQQTGFSFDDPLQGFNFANTSIFNPNPLFNPPAEMPAQNPNDNQPQANSGAPPLGAQPSDLFSDNIFGWGNDADDGKENFGFPTF